VVNLSRRVDRVEEICKQEIAEILSREIKDPRIGFVTVTKVKLSSDLKHAKVYVSILGTSEEIDKSLDGLKSAKGFVKRILGEHLKLKFMPEIEFVHDRVTEEAIQLTSLIERARKDDDSGNQG